MSDKPKFTSNREKFNTQNAAVLDMIQGHMAMDIEVAIKTTAGIPVKTGAMRADVRHFKSKTGQWRVEADKEYSAVQEVGQRMSGKGAPTDKFSNYTTAGTGAGWFKRAIDSVVKNIPQYITEARKAFSL